MNAAEILGHNIAMMEAAIQALGARVDRLEQLSELQALRGGVLTLVEEEETQLNDAVAEWAKAKTEFDAAEAELNRTRVALVLTRARAVLEQDHDRARKL